VDGRVEAQKYALAVDRLAASHVARTGLLVERGHHSGSAAAVLVEGAGVDDRLGIAITAEDDHQVGDHGRLPFIVEVDHVVLR
jgi:hypothetical protein